MHIYKVIKLFVSGILLVGYSGLSQTTTSKELDAFGRLNLGLHGLELSYELPLSRKIVWENNLGIGMGMEASGGSASYTLYLNRPTPFVKSQLKWMYNRDKRVGKDKSVSMNSGNFVGLQTKYSFGNSDLFELDQAILTEIHWGIQRNLGQRFLLNFQVGLGILSDIDRSQSVFSPTLGFRFGYRIF